MARGVESRGKSLRVYFQFEGETCREPLDLANTPENRAHAENLVAMIRYEIKTGAFDYAKHFPDSPRVRKNQLGAYMDAWLDIKKSKVAFSTFDNLRKKLQKHVRPKWGHRLAEQVDTLEVETWIATDLAYLNNKTIKEIVSILNQVFKLYQTRNRKLWNPVDGIEIALPDPDDPDPFDRDEIQAILSTPTTREQELNLIQFMIWTGARVSEALALTWEDVNLKTGRVKFSLANVRGRYKVTKTKRSTRELDLLAPALAALHQQKIFSFHMKPKPVTFTDRDNKTQRTRDVRFVFLNSRSMEPHVNDMVLRDRFFKTHLKKAGVRYRGPGQCRHTYASQLLSTGLIPPEWIAAQLGHVNTDLIYKVYGKYLPKDAKSIIDRANRALGFKPFEAEP